MFFAFNSDQIDPITSTMKQGYWNLLESNGFTSEMKLELFTLGRNSILLRVENIGDIFNTQGQVTY